MKAISNYHTHTQLCKHAHGRPLDYVKQAIAEGCSSLGFSDHCPYPTYMPDYWPEIRMSLEEVPTYIKWIEEAKKIAPFNIYMGFECEWDARYKSWYTDELKGTYKAQYLILGSHWATIGNEHIYCPRLESNKDLNTYIDQTIDGMKSGIFSFLAHPDLFMLGHREWDKQAQSCLKAILDAAVDLDMPLEINGLGSSRPPLETSRGMRYPYPYVEFWEMVAQTKVRVICNSDAHNPQDVIMNAWKARDFAGRFEISPIELLF